MLSSKLKEALRLPLTRLAWGAAVTPLIILHDFPSYAIVKAAGIEMAWRMEQVAQAVRADESWSTPARGRIIASISQKELLEKLPPNCQLLYWIV